MKTLSNIIVSTLLCAVIVSAASSASAEDSAPSHIVNLNTAGAAELESLPGIGPSKSQAIIEYRSKRPFAKVEDIMRVKGIGKKSFLKLKPYLTVSGGQSAAKSPSPQR